MIQMNFKVKLQMNYKHRVAILKKPNNKKTKKQKNLKIYIFIFTKLIKNRNK